MYFLAGHRNYSFVLTKASAVDKCNKAGGICHKRGQELHGADWTGACKGGGKNAGYSDKWGSRRGWNRRRIGNVQRCSQFPQLCWGRTDTPPFGAVLCVLRRLLQRAVGYFVSDNKVQAPCWTKGKEYCLSRKRHRRLWLYRRICALKELICDR